MKQGDVRVRMAPSPTGFFHVGSARTALYNWLFARHHGGKFLLRVEDTDIERSSGEMIQVILDGLKWLDLNWDEEPIYQSKRLELYEKHLNILIEKNLAYYCFCQTEDLEREKQKAYAQKKDWQYDRRCCHLSTDEREKKERAGIPKAVRFKVPDTPITYHDIVFGDITKEARDIEDFVIMRSNGMPTYNLSCMVDDHDMHITHVIRGADHIANTPKQVLLYNAFNVTPPQFAHLPLILGPDKSKLSKRHGAVSVIEYKDAGYLPEAFMNYLALLGWSPGDDTEVMTRDTLVERFSLERINASNAVFDQTKCDWFNQQYIMQLSPGQFKELCKPFIIHAELLDKGFSDKPQWLARVCALLQPRLKILSEVDKAGGFFFKEDFQIDYDAMKKSTSKETLNMISMMLSCIMNIKPFTAAAIEDNLRTFSKDNGWKVKQWIHALRVFTTGSSAGPPMFETLELIGKKRVIQRIENILKKHGDPIEE
jgi:glutamyl-tRNA synthetase/nondiscriminating glutamyl-tRNA synthetase